MQPLNRSFCCRLQKPGKALCGRRCRPLCPARGKQGNPSLSPAYFRTACRFSQSRAKIAPNGSLLCRACVYPIRGYISLHGATQGLTDGALAAISMSLICTHLAYFGMLCFHGLRLSRLRHGREGNSAGAHIYKFPHTRRHGFCIECIKRFFKFRFYCRTFL